MPKENERTIGNVVEEVKKCLNADGVEKVVFKIGALDKFPKCLSLFQLDLILSELTDNCVAGGATEITVTLEENKIRVEDNVRHNDAQETAKKLNSIRGSKDKNDSLRWQNIVFSKVGGIGISELTLGFLKQTGGILSYSVIDEERIVAEISWAK